MEQPAIASEIPSEMSAEIPSEKLEILPRGCKTIRINCEKNEYVEIIADKRKFKDFLNQKITKHPELFPKGITNGYTLYGKSRRSIKLDRLRFQRIKIKKTNEVFSVYPSFVMPYLIAYTSDVDKALLLRKHDVPYSTLVYIFGRDEMYWYRVEQAFGRSSIVGTTIKKKIIYLITLLPMKSIRGCEKIKCMLQRPFRKIVSWVPKFAKMRAKKP